jgi:NDP-sugar pyrophosphorylase family protein
MKNGGSVINKHCVVLAGGEGSRVAEITKQKIPKALIPIRGRPFLDFKIDSLIAIGFTEITFLLGKFSNQVVDYLNGRASSDVKIGFVEEASPLGTGGAILAALNSLPDTFWVSYADSLVFPKQQDLYLIDTETPVDESIMCVTRGNLEWGRSNVELSSDRVTFYSRDESDSSGKNLFWIEYGLLRFSKGAFNDFSSKTSFDLGEVIQAQVLQKAMRSLICKERFREVGNVRSFLETEYWFKTESKDRQ